MGGTTHKDEIDIKAKEDDEFDGERHEATDDSRQRRDKTREIDLSI